MITKEALQTEIDRNLLQQVRLKQKLARMEAEGDGKLRGLIGKIVLENLTDSTVKSFLRQKVLPSLHGKPAKILEAALNAADAENTAKIA